MGLSTGLVGDRAFVRSNGFDTSTPLECLKAYREPLELVARKIFAAPGKLRPTRSDEFLSDALRASLSLIAAIGARA